MTIRDEPLSGGALLRRYRVVARLTQEELAERSGYSVHYVSKLERDERRPPRAALERLVAALELGEEERNALWAALDGARQAQPSGSRLAGRAPELSEIRQHLAGLGPPVLMVSGEPGIGKTRLLEEAAARAVDSGWRVIRGGCQRRAQDPYAPLTGALAEVIGRLDPMEREEVLGTAGQLELLLPEFGTATGGSVFEHPSGRQTGRPQGSDGERRILFAAVDRFLRDAAGHAGTLLVLDDMQWTGTDAFDLLAAVLTAGGTPAVRLIAAYRDSETAADSPLNGFVADLARASLVRVLPLEPLSADDAGMLVSDLMVSGGENRALLPAIVRRAGGVPFFLVSYVDDVRVHGGAGSDLELPWNVNQVILQRVVALSEMTQEVLRVAAIVGRAVSSSLLSRVTGRSEGEVLDALDSASSARIVNEDGDGKYHFSHDLIRESIEGELSRSRRRLLHRLVGEALERDTNAAVESLAFHFDLSDDADRAIRYLERAGDAALKRFAHAAAADFYTGALDWIEQTGDRPDAAGIGEKLGIALHRSGRYDGAIAALERALDGFRSVGDEEGINRATGRLAEAHFQRGTGHEALDQVTRRVEDDILERKDGGSAGALTLREGLVRLLYGQGSFSHLLTMGRSLRRVGHATGNRRLQTMGTRAEGSALIFLGRLAEGATLIEDTLPENLSIERDRRAVEVATAASIAHLIMGAPEPVRVLSGRMLRFAESMNNPGEVASHSLLIGAAHHLKGEWQQAGDYLHHAREQFALASPSALSVRLTPILVDCLIREGRWEESRQLLEATLATVRAMRAYHPEWTALTFLGLLDLTEGRPQSTIARLAPHVTDDLGWAYTVTFYTALAEAYLETGEADRAESLAERAVSEARRMDAWLPGVDALRVLGLTALYRGNYVLAEGALDEALDRAQAMPFPYAEARILHVSALLDEKRGDSTSSRAKRAQALAILERLGATRQAERLHVTLV